MKVVFLLLLLLLLNCYYCKSQLAFNKEYFKNTEWASKNYDSSFFKADTIGMIKLIESDSLNIARYFQDTNFVTLKLNKCKKMKFLAHDVHSWMITSLYGKYKWMFNETNQVLSLYFNNKIIGSFVSISERSVEIESRYVDLPSLKTIEILYRRIK